MDLCHLKILELEPKFQKYKGRVVLRGDIVKDDSGSYAVVTEHQRQRWQPQQSWTLYPDFQDVLGKQPMQYPLNPSQNWRCPTLLKTPKSECPDIWIRLPKTLMAQIMVQYGRSGCSSWAESVRSSFGRTIVGKPIRESSIKRRLGKSSELGMSIC